MTANDVSGFAFDLAISVRLHGLYKSLGERIGTIRKFFSENNLQGTTIEEFADLMGDGSVIFTRVSAGVGLVDDLSHANVE